MHRVVPPLRRASLRTTGVERRVYGPRSEHREWQTSTDGRAPRNGDDRPSLSVVVPALNEAENVGDCLESVFAACSDLQEVEVVLVDSHSEDETIETAREYPVTIVQLSPEEPISPSAGRYVGTEIADGDHVLFVDGDMRLTEGWLSDARDLLESNPDVAGVGGYLNAADAERPKHVTTLNGVMLYDGAALESVGGFNPFLQGYEDIELGFRTRAAGYRLVRLPTVVAHHSRSRDLPELRRRWQRGYMFGFGQAFRRSLSTPGMIRDLLVRKWLQMAFLGWVLVGVGLRLTRPRAFLAWCVASIGGFVADALREGTVPAVRRFLWQGVAWPSYCYGFVRGTPEPSRFPLESVSVIAVQEDDEVRDALRADS